MPNWFKRVLSGRNESAQPLSEAAAIATSMSPLEEGKRLLAEGNALLNSGKIEDAMVCYERAVNYDPSIVDARVNLGYLLMESGRLIQARAQLEQVLALAPINFDALYMLANIAKHEGDSERAIGFFRQVIALKPDFPHAYVQLCDVLYQVGALKEMGEVAREGLAVVPDAPELYFVLGNLNLFANEFAQAVANYDEALLLRPDFAAAFDGKGLAEVGQGNLDKAIALHTRAIELDPSLITARCNLALAMRRRGDLGQAAKCYEEALALSPDDSVSAIGLAVVLQEMGNVERAVAGFRRVADDHPDNFDALNNLGAALHALGRYGEAEQAYRRALVVTPDSAKIISNLGLALYAQRRTDEAIEFYRKALAADSAHARAHANLAVALNDRGDANAAIEEFGVALTLDPGDIESRSSRLFLLSASPVCTPAEYLTEARQYGEVVTRIAKFYSDWPALGAKETPTRLRIGFVSGDLKIHPVGRFLEAVVKNLDRQRFELFAYVTSSQEDALTSRLKPHFSKWKSIVTMRDDLAAKLIHEDEINILIDLAGHTAHNRLSVFAWQPAPVQVGWLGYWASTGMSQMDYVLVDEVGAPASMSTQFVERLWRLPHTRMCYTAPNADLQLAVKPLPALKNGYVTFGSYQTLSKVTPAVLDAWQRVLALVPGSKLCLQNKQSGSAKDSKRIEAMLEAAGIDLTRVIVRPPSGYEEYLVSYGEIDILLDTFPFTGGTTTCEALWMGVPTVSMAGETLLARQGASLLGCVGLSEWVASDVDDYVDRAVAYAGDLARLADLRAGLREQALLSPLFNVPRFVNDLERALTEIWTRRIEA